MKRYERVILIDDNEADNVYHELMIRRSGFTGELLVFDNGEDALTFFRNDPMDVYTCVFLDINMPGMDGFEVASQATPFLLNKHTVIVIMLTSSGSAADRERAATIPIIKGYVTKPLDVNGLLPMITVPL